MNKKFVSYTIISALIIVIFSFIYYLSTANLAPTSQLAPVQNLIRKPLKPSAQNPEQTNSAAAQPPSQEEGIAQNEPSVNAASGTAQKQVNEYTQNAQDKLLELQELLKKQNEGKVSILNLILGIQTAHAQEADANEESVSAANQVATLVSEIQTNLQLAMEATESTTSPEEGQDLLETIADTQSAVIETLDQIAQTTTDQDIAAVVTEGSQNIELDQEDVTNNITEAEEAIENGASSVQLALTTDVEELLQDNPTIKKVPLIIHRRAEIIAKRRLRVLKKISETRDVLIQQGVSPAQAEEALKDVQQSALPIGVAGENIRDSAKTLRRSIQELHKTRRAINMSADPAEIVNALATTRKQIAQFKAEGETINDTSLAEISTLIDAGTRGDILKAAKILRDIRGEIKNETLLQARNARREERKTEIETIQATREQVKNNEISPEDARKQIQQIRQEHRDAVKEDISKRAELIKAGTLSPQQILTSEQRETAQAAHAELQKMRAERETKLKVLQPRLDELEIKRELRQEIRDNRQEGRTEVQDNRKETQDAIQENRQEGREEIQDNRTETRESVQGNRQEGKDQAQGNRQEGRQEVQSNRQEGRVEVQDNRQNAKEEIKKAIEEGRNEDVKGILKDTTQENRDIKQDTRQENKDIRKDTVQENRAIKQNVKEENTTIRKDTVQKNRDIRKDTRQENQNIRKDTTQENRSIKQDTRQENRDIRSGEGGRIEKTPSP